MSSNLVSSSPTQPTYQTIQLKQTNQIIVMELQSKKTMSGEIKQRLKDTQLQVYIKNGNAEGIKELVNEGDGVNLNMRTRNGTALMLAAKESHWNIVKLLIELGADINNTSNSYEWKILHYAAKNKWLPVLEIFVEKTIDLELKTRKGETPLMIAVLWNRKDVVELLVKAGVNLNTRDNGMCTALHHAAYQGNMDILKYLVTKNADVNIQCGQGLTPFHVVLRKTTNIELICCFIRAGANCNLADIYEITALNLICRKRLLQAIFLSIEKGAYISSYEYRLCKGVQLLRGNVLTQMKYCSQSIINKYNKKDLPDLYKVHVASDMLPAIKVMEIKDTSGVAAEIDRAVEQDIETNGYCNLPILQPLSLTLKCVKAFLEHVKLTRRASCLNRLKRLSLEECPPAKKRSFGIK